MSAFTKLKEFLVRRINRSDMDPEPAYDLWSEQYDNQPGNLILALDEELFNILIKDLDFRSSVVADVGCGTGRHWHELINAGPARLLGFDVSSGMLARLKEKIPAAETYLIKDFRLPILDNESCDYLISTLAVAHMNEFDKALIEWARILKPNGLLILTDYHPIALENGANRTFQYHNQSISVRNHIYPIESIKQMAGQLGLESIRFIERKIDESVVDFYQKQNAMDVYAKFKGLPIIYGTIFKKIPC
jgi:ubiquinone/menaquinone biosynthesis C-methylase UbiE